jgi:DNA-binding LacI/PurR family transcriptional regulator
MSVIDFDNLDFVETTSPSLSSVHPSGYQLGAPAARIVLDRVSGDTGAAKYWVAADRAEGAQIGRGAERCGDRN